MKYLSDENKLKLGYIDEVTTDIAILESKKLEKIYNKYKNDLSIDKQQQCERLFRIQREGDVDEMYIRQLYIILLEVTPLNKIMLLDYD